MQLEKVTKQQKRIYDDACGLAHALELIGERWSMLIVRELAYGPRRFSELKADLTGISANVLTQRLSDLEQRGIIRKAKLPPPASVQVYEATDWGLEAAPVIARLGRWAARSPLHDPTLPISHVAIMMSLETMIDPTRAGDLKGRLGFRLGETSYVAVLRNGVLDIQRGEIADCDVVFTAVPAALAGVIYGGAPLETIGVEGDIALARRFVTLFPLPEKVSRD
ncbi:MAG: transcriptional regulator [Sphingomonas sp.]|nr:transcriptional regulator [Sphingomonas sp.]